MIPNSNLITQRGGFYVLYFSLMLITYIGSLASAIVFYIWHITTIDTFNTITRYPVLLSPTHLLYGFIFVLYLALAYWLVQVKKTGPTAKRAVLFSGSMLLQIALFATWHLEYIRYMFIVNVLLTVTLYYLYRTYPIADRLARLPISLYLASVAFSMIFMFELTVVFYSFHGFGLSKQLWVIILLTFSTALALRLRYHYNDRAFSIAFIIIYLGIALRLGLDELLVTMCALFLSGVLVAGILYVQKNMAA